MNRRTGSRCLVGLLAVGLAVTLGAGTTFANTNMMPDRQALAGNDVVVWGNTDLAGGTAYTIDFGDGSPVVNGVVSATSQSYIAAQHAFVAGVYTATLTVGAEVGTADITVVDPSVLTPTELEDAQINSAVEDGLRYLYYAVQSREAQHDAGWPTATWDSRPAYTALATLAFENHGYTINNGDIYSPVVQAGLNSTFNSLVAVNLTVEPAGNPCIPGPLPAGTFCNGFYVSDSSRHGYSTGIGLLAIAGSGAPTAVVGTGAAAGQSFLDVAQRLANTIAWGQADSGTYEGGWRYGLDDNQSDGSAIGWNVLGLIDAEAFGATLPDPSVTAGDLDLRGELLREIQRTTNSTGALGYTSAHDGSTRSGVRLQALHLIGLGLTDVPAIPPPSGLPITAQDTVNYLDAGWNFGANSCAYTTYSNKGCLYTMYNAFKGLKLYGVPTLPSVPRADLDWHRDYQMYLAGRQVNPGVAAGGGNWGNELFSGYSGNVVSGETALALLILSKSATILPDDITFSLTNQAVQIGGTATITAVATTTSGAPVPGVSVDFNIVSGPHAGLTGLTDVTDANGEAIVQYVGTASGTDQIVASAGPVVSNPAFVIWFKTCDADGDLDIDNTDVSLILAARNTPSTGPGDPRDADGDGVITVLDARICVLMRGQ